MGADSSPAMIDLARGRFPGIDFRVVAPCIFPFERLKGVGMGTAVLFDLDDTIFDHRYCRRQALSRLMEGCDDVAARSDLLTLETLHERHLQTTHLSVLDGLISLMEARRERMRLLFSYLNVVLSDKELDEAESLYRTTYDTSRRAVPGSMELIRKLKKKMSIGIITNGLAVGKRRKKSDCAA